MSEDDHYEDRQQWHYQLLLVTEAHQPVKLYLQIFERFLIATRSKVKTSQMTQNIL